MIVLVLVGWVATGLLASASGQKYAGRSLGDVLRELQATGLNIVFSSEIVRPTMKVLTEPKAVRPREVLDEILRPHGLQVRSGPGGTLLVVRLREQTSSPVTVAGQVVAGANNAPVVGAAIEAGARRTVTDATGRFAIEATPGALRLEVTAKGFLTQRVDLTVVAGMSAIEIVVVVSPQFRETVTVSALESKEAPASPQVVLAPAAVQRVAGSGDNIFRALQTLPGVSATDDFSSRLAVRGGGPDQNLTVMDGVEIHNPYRLFGITSAFNPEIVDRFELTAGGFGAKYGDRLSSLLSVENRQGTTSRKIAGSATASFSDANVVLEGKLPGHATGSWLVTGRRTYYDLIAERIVDGDLPSFQDVQAKAVWDPKPGHRLTLFALRSRESADVADDDNDSGDQVAVGFTTRNDVAALSYSAPLGARASSRTTAAWYRYSDALRVDASSIDRSTRSNSLGTCGKQLSPCGPADDTFDREVEVFTRDINMRDVSVRQEVSVQAGRRHLFETGFDAHALRTGWGWTIDAATTRDAANGSATGFSPVAVGFGAGLPSLLRSTRDTTRAAVWFQDRYQLGAGRAPRTWPADRSQRRRGRDHRVSAARHSRGTDTADAAARRDRALHAEPRLRETPAIELFRRPDVRRQRPDQERAIAARDWRDRALICLVGDGADRSVCQDVRWADRRPARDPGGDGRARRAVRVSRRGRE